MKNTQNEQKNSIDKKRVVVYLRVSTDKQVNNTSFETQLQKIQYYCKFKNYDIVNVFTDKGISGKDTENRAGYNDMIKYISNSENGIGVVVCYDTSRIHRSLLNLLDMIEKILKPNNIAFSSVTQEFDTSTPQGRMFLNMLGAYAEYERELIGMRRKDGQTKKVSNGNIPSGRLAFGYEYSKDNKKNTVINRSQAEIIRDIFNMRIEGMSYKEISKVVDSPHYRKTHLKAYTGVNKNKQWGKAAIINVLRNEVYISRIRYGDNVYDGCYEPIINDEVWNSVQAINRVAKESNNMSKNKNN